MSFVYLREWEDSNGDVVEREVYCDSWCYRDSFDRMPVGYVNRFGFTLSEGGAWPGYESDYDEYCPECGKVAARGIAAEVQG